MKKQSAAQSATKGELELLQDEVIKTTGKSSRDIAGEMNYEKLDYITQWVSRERAGHVPPKKLIQKLRAKYAFELTGEKQMTGSIMEFIEKIVQENAQLRGFIDVLTKNVAGANSQLNGTSYVSEEAVLLKDMGLAAVLRMREAKL